MKPLQRRQLPPRLYNLSLVEIGIDDSIVVFCGDSVRPSYTPIFDMHDRLVGIFFTTMPNCIFSRRLEENKHWPRDRLFLDRAKISRYYQTHDVFAELGALNELHKESIDPLREARPLWERPTWTVDYSLSNIDAWVCAVEDRVVQLQKGTAQMVDKKDNMAFFGLVLSAVACLVDGTDMDLFYQLARLDELIELESKCWIAGSINYAYNFKVDFKSAIVDYPYMEWLKESFVVFVAVPEQIQWLGKNTAPFHMGRTYIGIKAFRPIAQRIFVHGWKRWAISIFRQLNAVQHMDPALVEFMSRTRIWKTKMHTKALITSSPDLLFPTLSPSAPACLKKLFIDGRNLKHYARWQLAELAIDMGWSKYSVLNAVKIDYRSEISAAMESYRRKGTTKKRCLIYMRSTDLCPYSTDTFRNCCSEVADIEDMSPSVSFQYRLMKNSE